MSLKRRALTIVLIAISLLLVAYLLEREGLFLLLGYTSVKLAGSLAAVVFLIWGISLFRSKDRVSFCAALAVSFVLVLAAWSAASLSSSPRKKFYLAATRIVPGESMVDVRRSVGQYESWEANRGYASFGFVSGPGTRDVVVVHYDVQTERVVESEFSPD